MRSRAAGRCGQQNRDMVLMLEDAPVGFTFQRSLLDRCYIIKKVGPDLFKFKTYRYKEGETNGYGFRPAREDSATTH